MTRRRFAGMIWSAGTHRDGARERLMDSRQRLVDKEFLRWETARRLARAGMTLTAYHMRRLRAGPGGAGSSPKR